MDAPYVARVLRSFIEVTQKTVALHCIEKRLRALEQVLFAGTVECTCRVRQKTMYHDAAELARIMALSCPIHSICDLGELIWVGRSVPLRREDQQFCSCPPSPLRELLMGRRDVLSEAEQRQEEQRWMREFGSCSDMEFRKDQDRVKQILRIYEFNRLGRN